MSAEVEKLTTTIVQHTSTLDRAGRLIDGIIELLEVTDHSRKGLGALLDALRRDQGSLAQAVAGEAAADSSPYESPRDQATGQARGDVKAT
jgi:hypothetical protein